MERKTRKNKFRKNNTRKTTGGAKIPTWLEIVKQCIKGDEGEANMKDVTFLGKSGREGGTYFQPYIGGTGMQRPHIHIFDNNSGMGYPSGGEYKIPILNESTFQAIDDKLLQWISEDRENHEASWRGVWIEFVRRLRNKIRTLLEKPTLEDEADAAERQRLDAESQRVDAERQAELSMVTDQWYEDRKKEFNSYMVELTEAIKNPILQLVIKSIIHPRHNIILCMSTINSTFNKKSRSDAATVNFYLNVLSKITSFVDEMLNSESEEVKQVFYFLLLYKFCGDKTKNNNISIDINEYLNSLLESLLQKKKTVKYVKILIRNSRSIVSSRSQPFTSKEVTKKIKSLVKKALAKRIERKKGVKDKKTAEGAEGAEGAEAKVSSVQDPDDSIYINILNNQLHKLNR
jgi:hypothetical protein